MKTSIEAGLAQHGQSTWSTPRVSVVQIHHPVPVKLMPPASEAAYKYRGIRRRSSEVEQETLNLKVVGSTPTGGTRLGSQVIRQAFAKRLIAGLTPALASMARVAESIRQPDKGRYVG